MAQQHIGKGRAAAKRRRENAFENLLKPTTIVGIRTAEQKQKEVDTLRLRIAGGK